MLRDAGIAEKTQQKYFMGLRRVLPILEASAAMTDMDSRIADWIQTQWEKGDALHQVSDALCAIHHYEPWTRKGLPESWKVFAVWRKLEAPNRAPPLLARVIGAWIVYGISHNALEFAAMIALGFYALLRTGELLQIRSCDLLIGQSSGVVSLSESKSGLRNAARETVGLQNILALDLLRATVKMNEQQGLGKVPIWSKSAQSFRNAFAYHIHRFDLKALGFRPCSLQRGGSTALFQQTGSMELALLKGTWNSLKVAKIYLSDGLSYIPGFRFTEKASQMLQFWSLKINSNSSCFNQPS